MSRLLALIILTFTFFVAYTQDLTIVSWNIRDFGQSRDEAEIEAMAVLFRHADLVAIQEVVAKHPGGAKAVARLADALDRKGADWDYIISDPTDSPSAHMSERYAYLWKKHKLRIKSGHRLLDEVAGQVYREPYYAVFEYKGKRLDILNFHSRRYDQDPQIEVSIIIDYMLEHEKANWILAGDYNLDEKNQVWTPLYRANYKPALYDSPTTLKMDCRDGVYLNHSIDNIYYNTENFNIKTSRVLDFVRDCSTVGQDRVSYSDHLPVEIKLSFVPE